MKCEEVRKSIYKAQMLGQWVARGVAEERQLEAEGYLTEWR